jgi:hypothetical protein
MSHTHQQFPQPSSYMPDPSEEDVVNETELALTEQKFCSGYGTYHTNHPDARTRSEYAEWCLNDLDLQNPLSIAKEQGQWVIPSIVCDEYARNHQHQRLYGKFGFAWFDIDEKGHSKEKVESVLDALDCDYYVYTTKSSTAEYPKWRGIIPYEKLISAEDHVLVQEIVNDLFEESGIKPDRINQRPAQIAFLPNRGDYYDFAVFDVWERLSMSSPVVIERLKAKRAVVKKQLIERQQKRELNHRKMQERIKQGATDVLGVFKELYPLKDMLVVCGYEKKGENRFLSPNSQSGIPGVTVDGDKWFSKHASDIGIGNTDSNGAAFGDVSDLWFHYFNGGVIDIQALKNFIEQETDFDFSLAAFEGIESDESSLMMPEVIDKAADRAMKFPLISVDELKSAPRSNDWLIKGIIEKNSYGMIFGEPASGKSLLMLDMAFCVAAGIDWSGYATAQGKVVYIAGEGFNGLKRRVTALETKYQQTASGLFFSQQPAALIDKENVQAVADAIEAICPEPVLIVIDTLHRNFGSGDENSSQDFGTFTSNIDTILRKSGATVLVVHHTGHGDKSRGRGSSSIKAALDVEYSVVKSTSDQVSMKCTKAKDFDEPEEQMFEIETVELDLTDEEDEPVKSVVINPLINSHSTSLEQLSPREAVILNALKKALDKAGCPPESILPVREAELIITDRLVALESWREQAFSDMDVQGIMSHNAKKQAFHRAKKRLCEIGLISYFNDYYWVT